MPKQFITEIDIEDLARRGVHSIDVNDSVVLTELAYEKAKKLGIQLVQRTDNPPAAPVRPYLSLNADLPARPPEAARPVTPDLAPLPALKLSTPPAAGPLHDRIVKAVHAKMGDQVEPELLEDIIRRVLNSLGMK